MMCKFFLWIQSIFMTRNSEEEPLTPLYTPLFLQKDEFSKLCKYKSVCCSECQSDFSVDSEYLNSVMPWQYTRVLRLGEGDDKCYYHLRCLAILENKDTNTEEEKDEEEHNDGSSEEGKNNESDSKICLNNSEDEKLLVERLARINFAKYSYTDPFVVAFKLFIHDKIALLPEDVNIIAQRAEVFEYMLQNTLSYQEQQTLTAKICKMHSALFPNQVVSEECECPLVYMLAVSELFYHEDLNIDALFMVLQYIEKGLGSNTVLWDSFIDKIAEHFFEHCLATKQKKLHFLLSYADFVGREKLEQFKRAFLLFLDSVDSSEAAKFVLRHLAFSRYAYLYACFDTKALDHDNFPSVSSILKAIVLNFKNLDWLMGTDHLLTNIDHFLAWVAITNSISNDFIATVFEELMRLCIANLKYDDPHIYSGPKTFESILHFIRHNYNQINTMSVNRPENQAALKSFANCSLVYDWLLTKIIYYFSDQILEEIDIYQIIETVGTIEAYYELPIKENYLFLTSILDLSKITLLGAVDHYMAPTFKIKGILRVMMQYNVSSYEFKQIEKKINDRPTLKLMVEKLLHISPFVTRENIGCIRSYLNCSDDILYDSMNNSIGFYDSLPEATKKEILYDMIEKKNFSKRGNIIFSIKDKPLLKEHVMKPIFKRVLEESWIIWHLKRACRYWLNNGIPLVVTMHYKEFEEIANAVAVENESIKPYLQEIKNQLPAEEPSENPQSEQ
ncbi:hypothetical protein ENBRE01_2718 [Enteropsectra breve]|nr:hypothetical protein ENBRE01_2718 [Enteropsectra breve]